MFVVPNLNAGGAERVIAQLSQMLSILNCKVTIVLLRGQEQFYQVDDAVNIVWLKLPHIPIISKAVRFTSVWYRLRKLYLSQQPDVVIGFMTYSNIFAIASSMFLKTKVIISERNAPSSWNNHGPVLLMLRDFFYPKANAFLAQTPLAALSAQQWFPASKCRIISNPIRTITPYPDCKKEKLILNVARLEPQKGHVLLLQAFAALDAPDWKLCILGDGSRRDELKRMVNELNLQEKVIMPGNVEEVDLWYARASIFAFSSLFEGIPNALIEAMSAGIAAVSFDCETGPGDLIQHGVNGLLIPQKDTKELQMGMQQLIDDPLLRLALGIEAKKIRLKHNKESIAKEVKQFCFDVN